MTQWPVKTPLSATIVKGIAWLTVVMSIPLLLSYNIKYQKFPEGFAYVCLYFWGLASVFVTPALLGLGLVNTVRIRTSPGTNSPSLLSWNLAGMFVGVVAEIVFLLARHSSP
jgi:hypothetical protein